MQPFSGCVTFVTMAYILSVNSNIIADTGGPCKLPSEYGVGEDDSPFYEWYVTIEEQIVFEIFKLTHIQPRDCSIRLDHSNCRRSIYWMLCNGICCKFTVCYIDSSNSYWFTHRLYTESDWRQEWELMLTSHTVL